MWFQALLLAALCTSALAEVNLTPTGSTLTLNGISYFVPAESVARFDKHVPRPGHGWHPVTVTTTQRSSFSQEDYERLRVEYNDQDDVFQDAFLQALYIQGNATQPVESTYHDCTAYIGPRFSERLLPPGPYFVDETGSVHQAWRLYSDPQGAFVETVIENDGAYLVLPANGPGQSLAVAVPSRLYFSRTLERPLAGVRIAIKDIFDLKGIRSSVGNRAWYNLYPPANTTAPAIQELINAGAVIIGKVKTSQFAIGKTATADWVDVHAPFNPRGDGYQDPSSSSAGPAAAIASYEWLDLSIGTDTGGSVRSPSQVNGIFGNRPSHGVTSLDNVVPISPELDTIGILARDPALWKSAAEVLYQEHINATIASFPSSILAIGFVSQPNNTLDSVLSAFLASLTSVLSAGTTIFDINESWSNANPTQPPLGVLLNRTYDMITAKRQAELVRDPFYADYAAAFDGRTPFVNPSPLARWAVAESADVSLEDEFRKKALFQDWINNDVLLHDDSACSKSLLVYVPRRPAPNYRNKYLNGITPPAAFSTSRIAPLAGTPDIVLQIGELEYFSNITNHNETLPISVDLVARKGCDGMLFALVELLLDKGIIKKVEPGRSTQRSEAILL